MKNFYYKFKNFCEQTWIKMYTPEKTIYILLTIHALKRATNKDELNQPEDAQTISNFLNDKVKTGYFSENGDHFVLESTDPPVRAFLYLADDIGPDSYRAATFRVRKGAGRYILNYGVQVGLIWDFENVPRTFERTRRIRKFSTNRRSHVAVV